MDDLETRAIPWTSVRVREHVFRGTEDERERCPELVADVREKLRLRAVELRQRLRASSLALARAGVLETRFDLTGDEVDEAEVSLVELAIRVGSGNQESRGPLVRGLCDRHD